MRRTVQLEHKNIPVAHFKALDTAQGIIEAIVNVFGIVDSANERTLPGSFADSLKARLPKGVWMHQWDQPVAKTLEARELLPGDPLLPAAIQSLGGLYIKGQFNLGTQRGREAFSDLEFGSVDEFSIGYLVEKSQLTDDGVRELVKNVLYEWSPVLVGCNPATALIGLKDAQMLTPPPSKTITLHGQAVEVKSQYLGQYIEGQMTYAALSELVDALFYNLFYDVIYGSWDWDDEENDYVRSTLPVDDGAATLTGACAEFSALVVATYRALMAGTGGEAVAAAKSLQAAFAPEIKSVTHNSSLTPLAGARLAKHSEQVLADVQELTRRVKSVQDLRVKEGRTLSESTRGRLKSNLDALNGACDDIAAMLEESGGTQMSVEKSAAEASAAYTRFLASEAAFLGVEI